MKRQIKRIRITCKLSDHVFEAYGGPFKESTAPMVDLVMNKFKYLNTVKLTAEESFMNAYTEDNSEQEQIHTDNKRLRVILYAKYERENLHKVM